MYLKVSIWYKSRPCFLAVRQRVVAFLVILQNHRKRVLAGEVSRGTFVPIIIETNEKKNSYAGTPRNHL